jgi:hypothetical protein
VHVNDLPTGAFAEQAGVGVGGRGTRVIPALLTMGVANLSSKILGYGDW